MNDTPALVPEPAPSHENVLGRRIVAALIDIALLSVVLGVFVALWGDTEAADGNASFNLNGLPALAYLVIVLAYYAAFEAALSQTPGKMIMGLEVRSVSGEPASPGAAVVRTVLRVIDGLPFLYLVGLVTAAVTKRNQRVGDLAARTLVVRKAR